jgi:hypothetical protein
VHYRAYDRATVDALARVATDLRLALTGGTDYHGDRETYAEAHAQLWNPPEVAAGLRAVLGGAATELGGPATASAELASKAR